jgi:hypothetical protein
MDIGLAIVMIASAAAFWFVFKGYDKIDEELDSLDKSEERI